MGALVLISPCFSTSVKQQPGMREQKATGGGGGGRLGGGVMGPATCFWPEPSLFCELG